MMKIELDLDEQTVTIMQLIAESYRLDLAHLLEQQLYRDAASASGWPGELGTRLRRALRDLRHPESDPDLDDPGF